MLKYLLLGSLLLYGALTLRYWLPLLGALL